MKIKKGFSLIELLLALAIILIITISAFLIYKKVRFNSDIQRESERASMIESGVRELYRSQPQYAGIDSRVDMTHILKEAQILKESEFNKDGQIISAWGGIVKLTPARRNDNFSIGGSAMILEFQNTPRDYCIAFISKVYGMSTEIGVNDGNNLKNDANKYNFNQIPTSKLSDYCNYDYNNDIKLTFY